MIEYGIKVLMIQILLFLFYQLFFSKEKFYHFNRYYLILALVISVIIPLIKIPAYLPFNIFAQKLPTNIQPDTLHENQSSILHQFTALNLPVWVLWVYILFTLVFAFRALRNLFSINLVALAYKKSEYLGYELILTNREILPYSFLKRIFVNENDFNNGKISTALLQHEIYHIEQRHSIDILIGEIIQMIFWFNPVLFFHNRAIRLNHEYLADQAVVKNQVKLSDYSRILIESIAENKLMPITSGFSVQWTKKRLMMMSKGNSVFSSTIKLIIILPVIFLLSASFMFTNENKQTSYERKCKAIFEAYPNFSGSWIGLGKFNNIKLNKEVGKIPIELVINNDMTATGTAGDATLQDIKFIKRNYGIEIQAKVSQPVRTNDKIKKKKIIILWGLPEVRKDTVSFNFHLVNNYFFDPFLNIGGGLLTKENTKPD